jgi:hypothetical protein
VAAKAGERVAIAVTLRISGATIAGTQNDLHFDGVNITVAARTDGSPDCTVDPAIHKDGTSFAFFPHGCAGAACTSVRALIFALDNVDPIADGSVLYTCNVDIAADAADGVYVVTIDNIVLSDPHGNGIHGVGGVDGQVFVGATPTPTFTWTPRPVATRTATPPATTTATRPLVTAGPTQTATVTATPPPSLRVSSAAGKAGERVTIAVTLHSSGAAVAGAQNDLHFDGVNITVAAGANGSPDCTVDPTIHKDGTSFAFLPHGCTGATCTSVRALVFSLDNVDPIADGSVLYRCNVDIAAEAPDGVYVVTIDNIALSDPRGNAFHGVGGVYGLVFVGATPTPTFTWTPRPVATRTATPTFAATLPAASLRVSSVASAAGARVTIAVTLQTDGALIAGTQNDLHFDGVNISIAARLDGTPDCTVEPAIRKNGTAFAFLASDCAGAACTTVRALVLALGNVDPIADGSALYQCTVEVAAGAANGVYPLSIDKIVMSGPQGNIPARFSGIDGRVFVGQVPPAIAVSVAAASPGTQVSVTATLHTNGALVAGTQNDISFDLQAPIAANANGKPDCAVNFDINKGATFFAFRPNGCSGTTCTTIRALVLSTDNTDQIPDGSVLYTCKVNVAADASGFHPLTISNVILGTPEGAKVPDAIGIDGAIILGDQ